MATGAKTWGSMAIQLWLVPRFSFQSTVVSSSLALIGVPGIAWCTQHWRLVFLKHWQFHRKLDVTRTKRTAGANTYPQCVVQVWFVSKLGVTMFYESCKAHLTVRRYRQKINGKYGLNLSEKTQKEGGGKELV